MLVESWGIDSGPFDMLICLLTALIAPSSHRRLQREDAFQKDVRGEERRGEEREERRGEERRRNVIILLNPFLTLPQLYVPDAS